VGESVSVCDNTCCSSGLAFFVGLASSAPYVASISGTARPESIGASLLIEVAKFRTGARHDDRPAGNVLLETKGNGRNSEGVNVLNLKAGDGDRTRDVQLGKMALD
jgi:hypothetical protein